ncbi:MAG: hypothetical protein JJ868_17610 [Shimia sp.]|uniref:hypothetical protein n=1 Tax=Shimia sp. TaxID=1954381 RepID=UPI001A02D376|nr:hypothetical protein [Shimia sp.]MBE1292938.1 hypothetical protein [Paracoccaceae bacterium]MBO6899189.1 hypothetical protein [Shimia sp.]
MTVDQLLNRAEALETKIHKADTGDRYELHQQLHRTLMNIEQSGGRVPARLRRLDLDLLDQEIEDSFDNMPV